MITNFNGLDGYCLLPCQHEGICINGKCECKEDYVGKYCEKIKKRKEKEKLASPETLNMILIFVSVFSTCIIILIMCVFWNNNKVNHTFHRKSSSIDGIIDKEAYENELNKQKPSEYRFSGFSTMIINRNASQIDNNN